MQGSVRKRGEKWYYSFELAQVGRKRKRIERVGGRTKKDALTAMRKAMEEYEQAGQVFSETGMSMADYLDYWHKNYVTVSLRLNTQLSYASAIGNIKRYLGTFHLSKVNPGAVQDFLDEMFKASYSYGTIKQTKAVLNKAMTMAVYPYQFIKDNPVKYATIPRAAKKADEESKIITKKQFQQMLELFPRETVHHLPLMVGYHTGLRKSEILGLTWDCIDLNAMTLSVKRIQVMHDNGHFTLEEPKTPSSTRTISISSHLARALKDQQLDQKRNALKYGSHYEHSDFVCTLECGRPTTVHTLRETPKTTKRNLDFHFSYHMLRHTHGSMLLAAGVPMKTIQLRLGHSDIKTTMNIYAHETEELRNAAIPVLERLGEM